ncbi:MAG TPA: D-arabinono-1,4-lactone oxidase [Pseudonocardiaceae bacterium]|jgi:xylitol oxidase|nr:D-arabinono-1,4-lactone oxidase [Pseudonocardiaceae bacterium]
MTANTSVVGRETNWAGNVTYRPDTIHQPSTVEELQAIIARHDRVRAVGKKHSFNELPDTSGALVSLANLPPVVDVDAEAATAYVTAATSYADLSRVIDQEGFALPTLASLPHVSVAGACATATHGSGVHNGGLANSVNQLDLVTADGDLVTLSRDADPEQFDGIVVHLGALGVVVNLTLRLVPHFGVRQHVYENLPLDVLTEHFTELVSSAHSVCLFTDWCGPWLTQVWIQRKIGDPVTRVEDEPWFTATPATAPRHPVAGFSADSCTAQLGIAGRWFERLPHFRPEYTPSSGAELQSEYLIDRGDAPAALHALDHIRDLIRPVLQICEFRTVAADDLWLSPAYHRDSVSIHFTWIADAQAVLPVASLVERALEPFQPRPHWAKVFTTPPETVRSRYERLPDFRSLMGRFDPTGKFRNAFIDRYLGENS